MKKIIILVVMVLGINTAFTQDIVQPNNKMIEKPLFDGDTPKWRALTINTQVGAGTFGYNTTSLNLFYELDNGIAITSWVGYNLRFNGDNGWSNAQFLVNKMIGDTQNLRIGTGFSYASSADNPFASNLTNENTSFFVIEASYRIKFK
jgi:hypothetical protein